MLEKTKSVLRKSESLVTIWHLLREKYYKYFFSDEEYIRKRFRERLGRELDLKDPKKFNDKLQWLKINWYSSLAVKCADKYEVRDVVKNKIGAKYLNKLYGVYESVEEIDINSLPEQFVLKGTHGSGFNIICKDKSNKNWDEEYKKMKRWLLKNHFWSTREWVYKDIKPRIIAEKYLEQPKHGELRDYKIFCFNGEPKFIEVDIGRFKNHKRNIYDLDWNLMDVEIKYPSDKKEIIKKPHNLDKMIKLSKILSEGFPHVRVDFYYYDKQIIFGELTFFHGSGLEKISPSSFEEKMGDWLKLPN